MMKAVDDMIKVKHLIICKNCYENFNFRTSNRAFTNMNDWLNHKHATNHVRESHSAAVIIGKNERIHKVIK